MLSRPRLREWDKVQRRQVRALDEPHLRSMREHHRDDENHGRPSPYGKRRLCSVSAGCLRIGHLMAVCVAVLCRRV